MPIQTVIFDMDGVLVDSEPYWFRTREEFTRDLGKSWTDALQRMTMGVSTVEWARIMVEQLELDMTIEELIKEIKRRMLAHYEERLPVLPGAVEAVHTAAKGYPVALASGSPTELIDKVLQLTGLDKVFKTVVYGDTISRGKPAPDIYFEAARRLAVSPAQCIGIEDSANGIRSLKAAGMKAIAVPSPEYPLADEILKMADHVLPSLVGFSVDLVKTLE